MKFSFVIPAKNEEKRIHYCLESIAAQEPGNYSHEVIVVDNGSTDNTVALAKSYGAVVHVKSDFTIGQMRNFGAALATGDVIIFADSDVVLAPDYILHAAKHLDDPSIGIVTGRIRVPAVSTWVQRTWDLNRQKSGVIENFGWASSMNMVIKKSVFLSVGGFSENLVTCEDVDVSHKVSSRGLRILYDEAVSVVHLGDARNLKEFFFKERWRGRSLAHLKLRTGKVSSILSLLQFHLFILASLLFFLSISCGMLKLALVASAVALSLPLMRAIHGVSSSRRYGYFPQLLIVWSTYYVARSFALLTGQLHLLLEVKVK